MNYSPCRLLAAFILLTAGCSSLPLISKPADTETSISMGKGKVTEPTTATPGSGAASAPAAAKPSTSNGAPSGASKPSSSSAESQAPGAETALKVVAAPTNLRLAPIMPAGQVTDVLYLSENGRAVWEIEASRGPSPIKLGKARLSYQSTARSAPPASPTPSSSSSMPLEGMGGEVRSKGTPVTFDLALEDLGLSKSIAPGDKRSVDLALKHDRTLDFLKANSTTREFELSIELFDEAGSPVKGTPLIAVVKVL